MKLMILYLILKKKQDSFSKTDTIADKKITNSLITVN